MHMQNTTINHQQTSPQVPNIDEETRNTPCKISSAALVVLVFIAISQLAAGIYIGVGLEPSGRFTLLQHLVLFWLVGDWLLKDNRRHHIAWVFDMGFFLYLAWPLIIPFYLFKTRGFKALWSMLGVIGLYFGAALIGMLASWLFLGS